MIEEAVSEAVKMMGYSHLTTKKEEVVKAFIRGQDVFVSLPTGSRKSLCYCILHIIFHLLSYRAIDCSHCQPTHCADEGSGVSHAQSLPQLQQLLRALKTLQE